MVDLRHPVVSTVARQLERLALVWAGKLRAAAGDLLDPYERQLVEQLREQLHSDVKIDRFLARKVLAIIDTYLGDPNGRG